MSDQADDRSQARGGMADPKFAFKIGDLAGHIMSDGQELRREPMSSQSFHDVCAERPDAFRDRLGNGANHR